MRLRKVNYIKMNKNAETLCRVCLTQSRKMIQLNSPLHIKKKDSPLVIEALEKVMSVKIACDHRYPKVICPMCLGLLKISYDLKLQFLNSQKILQAHFKDTFDPLLWGGVKENGEELEESSVLSPVEVIVGPNKYDLKDLVIIEEEKEDQDYFKGFLNNLGKTVTAKFVNKSKCSPKYVQEEPIVLIEKIGTKNVETNNTNIKKNKVRKVPSKITKNIDQYIITQDDELSKSFDQAILKENVNLEEFGLENPTDIDQELFQSALNMQLKCDNCQKLYSSRGRFKKHLEICGKLEYQIIEDEKGQPTITSSPLLGCHICSRTFKQRKFLNYHVKTAHNVEPSKYTCEICGHMSRNRNSFTYHKLTKHGERKFICHICGKKFFTSSSLKTHTQNHTQRDVAQCICPVCGKTFHYKGGLFYHMKLHTNERKYCCEYCDRRFYTLMAQKRHTLTHTGIRPYACKFCEKKFFSTGEVRKHEYLHTGFRPYRCQYCKKGFSSAYNMKVHLVSHPGPFMCKICDKTFVTGVVLQFHLKMKHGTTEENEDNSD